MFKGRGEAETENIREWSKGEVLEWPRFDQSERGIEGDNEESSADDNNISCEHSSHCLPCTDKPISCWE